VSDSNLANGNSGYGIRRWISRIFWEVLGFLLEHHHEEASGIPGFECIELEMTKQL
jgi:hypothetical protein